MSISEKYFLGLLHFNPCFNVSNDVYPVCIRKHIKKGVGNKISTRTWDLLMEVIKAVYLMILQVLSLFCTTA